MDKREQPTQPQDPIIDGQSYTKNSVLRAAYEARVENSQKFLLEAISDKHCKEVVESKQSLVEELREREDQGILTKDEVNNILVELLTKSELDGMIDFKTGLLNEQGFKTALARDIAHADRTSEDVVLLYIDLVGFKNVNDTLGHAKGDAILKDVAEFIKRNSREEDLLARPHGDEFLAAFRPISPDKNINPEDEKTWEPYEDRLKRLITHNMPQFIQEKHGIQIAGRVGVAKYEHKMSVSDLIKAADNDMNAQRDASQGSQR